MVRFCIFLFCILLTANQVLGSHPVDRSKPVRVGIFPFEPINFINHRGEAQGLYPDLVRNIIAEEDWSVEFVPGTWAQGLERLQKGEIDLMTTIAYSSERAKVMDFNTEAVLSIWGQVFLRPGSQIENITDLEGLKVAITDRDISGENFIKTIAELGVNCEIRRYPKHADVFTALQSKEVDAGVAPSHFGLRHVDEFGLVASSIQFSPFSVYFATKKGHYPYLLQHIDEHLAAYKSDKNSYYYQRLNYWMSGQDIEKKIIPLWLLVSLGLAFWVALFLFFVSFVFKRQVRKTTAELRSREREYRRLVQSINNIVLRVDTQGTILFINRYGREFFGFEKDEIVGKNVMETIVPAQETSGRELQPIVEEVLSHPAEFETVENENICKDGRRVYIQWRNQPEYDEAGNIVGIFSVGADITERRQAEAELRSKEEKFRTLFEHVADYALVLQPRGDDLVIVDLNESACRQHGYRREELVGQSISVIDTEPVTADDPRLSRLAGGETVRFEVTHRRKDGSTFPVDVVTKLITIDGKSYIFSIERDLTLRKKAESENAELEKSLRQKFKMEAIGTLAGGIAHDFNNILAIILGTAEMLRRKLPQDDGNTNKVDRIITASHRAKDLVDQVLTFSRGQEQRLEPVEIIALVEDTIGLLRATLPSTVELKQSFAAGCEQLRVNADSTQLQQVLINLCSNAVFAMQEKGAAEIGVQKAPLQLDGLPARAGLEAGEYLLLSVTDTGEGIEAEDLDNIFDPFFTTKPVGQGTGMGLAVVHGIIQSHHGFIRVDSQPGEGTRFDIYLPLTTGDLPVFADSEGPLLTGSERILFVDDEEDLSRWAEELLTLQGFRPVTCLSSKVALELFRGDPQAFDMLITDQTMPELSGLELIAEVRKIRPDLPVILCTGYSTRVTGEVASQNEIDHIFYKPYREAQLLVAIRDCLDGISG